MKMYRGDVIAFLLAIAVLLGVFFALPEHLGLLRGIVAFVIAGIVMGGYMVIRKPDAILELEELLKQTAQNAAFIARVGEAQGRMTKIGQKIINIAQTIAHVATKSLTRDLNIIDVHVRRLARVAHDFRVVLGVFTGDIKLRGAEAAAEIKEIETKKIPGVLQALEDIEVAIDDVQAKQYAAAESDLETLTQLADLSKRAEEAVAILKQIVQDSPK